MGYMNGGMQGFGGISVFAFIFWLVLFIDALLLGIWLWQRVSGK